MAAICRTTNLLSPIEGVERENRGGHRFYKTPDGTFPSVTTILSEGDKGFLDGWANRIGKDNAKRITRASANRGTQVHLMAENFLRGLDPQTKDSETKFFLPLAVSLFKQIQPELEKIENVLCLESFLYSSQLGIAGTVDCIGDYDGILSTIDFKTARSLKEAEHILDYFIQVTAYTLMVKSCYNILPQQCVIIIAVENQPSPQVFKVNPARYARRLVERIERYKKNNGEKYDSA